MSCDCLKNIAKKLVEAYGDTVELETETMMDLKTGSSRGVVPPLRFTYRKTPKGKVKRSYVAATHCQFCGQEFGR